MEEILSAILWFLVGTCVAIIVMATQVVPVVNDLEHRLEIVKIQRDLVNEILIDYHECHKLASNGGPFTETNRRECNKILGGLAQ